MLFEIGSKLRVFCEAPLPTKLLHKRLRGRVAAQCRLLPIGTSPRPVARSIARHTPVALEIGRVGLHLDGFVECRQRVGEFSHARKSVALIVHRLDVVGRGGERGIVASDGLRHLAQGGQ